MEDNYPKAYKEVIEILNFVPQESVDKIPQKIINVFKLKMDENHNFTVDINKNFEQQHLLEETKAIFANIFRDYWATPYQKEKIKEKEKLDRQILEEQKRQQYNPEDLFKKRQALLKETEQEQVEDYRKSLPIKSQKINFVKKLINFIKGIFQI